MAELGGLNSATIDGFAATLRSSFYLGKTPEATPHRPGYSKGQELQDYFPNELWSQPKAIQTHHPFG